MYSFGISHWLVMTLIIAIPIWLTARIAGRAGFSGWWGLVSVIPLLNLVMVWVFAFTDWPAVDTISRDGSGPDAGLSPDEPPR